MFLVAFATANALFGQDIIGFDNPSFEDVPRHSKAPKGWYDCGFPGESPPDVQPGPLESGTIFGVTQIPSAGNTYLGMVTRDNDTWEGVSTRFSSPLKQSTDYHFSIDLASSDTYISRSRLSGEEVNYDAYVQLRIWLGNGYCGKKQLAAVSPTIDHEQWRKYHFVITPDTDYKYLFLECFYASDALATNGNLILDDASSLNITSTHSFRPALF